MATFPVINLVRSTKIYKTRKHTSTEDYRALYRFDESNVQWIAKYFIGENGETRGKALTPQQQMQIFLRYISDPGFQTGVGEDLGVDQSTVCKTIHKVKELILQKANAWIKFPTTNNEILKAKEEWQQKYSIPYVIGAIDCTHVRICKPKENGDEYLNRKRYPSINVQATCNSNELFTSVVADWPGSVHDSRIFKTSQICKFLKENTRDTVLIGDSGYGSAPWLIAPYENPTTDIEKYFNRIYAKDRVIIERCFGQVKRRFPILHYKVRVAINSVPGIILCCFVLHNVAKYLKDPEDFLEFPGDAHSSSTVAPEKMSDVSIRIRGQQLRNRIANLLYTSSTV